MAIFYWLLDGLKWKCWRIYNFCCNLFWVYGSIDWTMGTVAASDNNQLPCPLYWVCLSDTCCVFLCYIGIIQYYCYILLIYCYIVLCVYITHCTHIFNHCNDLALNGSLIGNKHICIVLYCITYRTFLIFKIRPRV
jgi:hypothetical protein